jgi:hypothetical protein
MSVANRFFRTFFFLSTGTPGVRFLKYDKPTELSFRQLFDSVGFLKEKDDTSTISTQGFTKLASDAVAQNRDSTPGSDFFALSVRPHQLPNCLVDPAFPLNALNITPLNQATGRIGGTGKDFIFRNTLTVTAPGPLNPIVVTQANPGENVSLTFNFANLGLQIGQVLVNALDPTPSYLEQAITSVNACRLLIAPNVTNDTLDFEVKDKVGEVTMYHQSNAQFGIDFPGGIGVGCWLGWVWCDGTSYLNSQAVLVATPDMKGFFPIGYDPAAYLVIGSHADNLALSGANAVALTPANLPPHIHEAGTLVTGIAGAHSHTTTNGFKIIGDGNAGVLFNAAVCDASGGCGILTNVTGDHTHPITGLTGDGSTQGLLSTAHENRPPFTILVFAKYIG